MAGTKVKPRTLSRGAQLPGRGLAEVMAKVEKPMLRSDFPLFKAGDTVRVHVKIKEGEKERIQAYDGVVIARTGKGASKAFTVRKISHGVGVERTFLEASPKVAKLEVMQSGRVRRAKLYYIRGLEGKAAKIEREVETGTQAAQAAASAANKSPKASK